MGFDLRGEGPIIRATRALPDDLGSARNASQAVEHFGVRRQLCDLDRQCNRIALYVMRNSPAIPALEYLPEVHLDPR